MPLECIYHDKLGIRVVNAEEVEVLTASGEWYRHKNVNKENLNEKPSKKRKSEDGSAA